MSNLSNFTVEELKMIARARIVGDYENLSTQQL